MTGLVQATHSAAGIAGIGLRQAVNYTAILPTACASRAIAFDISMRLCLLAIVAKKSRAGSSEEFPT